jgi:hypothetical protein
VSNWGWLIQALPPEDRVWGEALVRELREVPTRERPRWALGLLRLTGMRIARRVSSRHGAGLWIGALVGLVIAGDLAHSNLGPGSAHPASEPLAPVLVAFALLGVLFVMTGFVQRGHGVAVADCARTTSVAAVVIVVAAFLTTLVIDNFWLQTVARQPDKIYGLAHSPLFHTMRAYLIGQDVLGLLIVMPVAAALAAGLGALGARTRGR